MAIQTIEEALADIAAENGLTRIDVGLTNYSTAAPYIASLWFDAPEGVNGHAAEHGATLDEAVANAIATKDAKLAAVTAEPLAA